MTIYDAVYELIALIFPLSMEYAWWDTFITIFTIVITTIIFYIVFIRPFICFIKFAMFGNSNRSYLKKK